MIEHTIASIPVEDDTTYPVASDVSDDGFEFTIVNNPEPKRCLTVPVLLNTVRAETIPDFHAQAINYYLTHQDLCFQDVLPGTPMLLTLQNTARRLEITWFINHPHTPPTFIHCLQTVVENKRLMVAIRLESIRRHVGIHYTHHRY